jgi:oxygen-independent coproporphyrinogen-3 oxidase
VHQGFGLYVHVPFCASKCPYCDFNSQVMAEPPWDGWGAAVISEMRARVQLFAGQPLSSLYFGGGTPSLAPVEVVARVVEAARALADWSPDAEVTLEANPADLGRRDCERLISLGINRLSLGWQSTHDELLQRLGRRHSREQASDALVAARRAGFDNVSIDLMFAVPGQSLGDLEADLTALEEAAPEHVSIYALTWHEGTPFESRRCAGELVPVSEDLEVEMMARIDERLCAAGFEHYEVSNYARPGRRARHNSLYWSGAAYLGVGPGAHSFVREEWRRGWRWESIRDPQAHMRAWSEEREAGLPRANDVESIEELTPRQLMAERMMLGLRTSDGIELEEPAVAAFADEVTISAAAAVERGWAALDAGRLRPTPAGFLHNDALAALFF